MYKPVDVDVYIVRARRGLDGEVHVAIATGRIPSETNPKFTAFIIPPKELEEKKDKYKGKIKKIDIESDEFKSLNPIARELARKALRAPSAHIPEEVLEELE
ncbi:hypothetical protein IPA_09670 [Ignicoccus pacificus DSM 13166]|uniref:Uncharacterized protein n=1 Tax=Ignicoccus pacificus DSM 13166 TaxID=940294 RepID=A0A977KC11_9CREN|nr:hypothetical protein IPA_09670 [Ignicoccus pacificus DSM 13166]